MGLKDGQATSDEGHVGHLWWHDVAVEVEAILLDLQLLLDQLIEDVVVLCEARAVDHQVLKAKGLRKGHSSLLGP